MTRSRVPSVPSRLVRKASAFLAILLLASGLVAIGASPDATTSSLVLELREVRQGLGEVPGPTVEVRLRNAGHGYILVNPFLLPEPWKNASNFPVSALWFEVLTPDGRTFPFVGDGSAGVLDPKEPCFGELLVLGVGRFYGVQASLSTGYFAHGIADADSIRVRAHYLSRTREWYERHAERANADCRGPGEMPRVFDGRLQSDWLTLEVKQ